MIIVKDGKQKRIGHLKGLIQLVLTAVIMLTLFSISFKANAAGAVSDIAQVSKL